MTFPPKLSKIWIVRAESFKLAEILCILYALDPDCLQIFARDSVSQYSMQKQDIVLPRKKACHYILFREEGRKSGDTLGLSVISFCKYNGKNMK